MSDQEHDVHVTNDESEPVPMKMVNDPIRVPGKPTHGSRWMLITALLTLVVLIAALAVVGYSLYVVSHTAQETQQQNRELRAQVASLSGQTACRQRANFDTVAATAEVIELITKIVAAAGDPEQAAALRAQLPVAIDTLDKAIAAQDAAIPRDPGDTSSCDVPTLATP